MEVAVDASKKSRPVVTLDDMLDKEEDALKASSVPYIWCTNSLIENLQQGRILFLQRKLALPEKQENEPMVGKSVDEVIVSPEMREQVKQSLEEREKRRQQEGPKLNLASVSLAEYARSLPSYAVQKGSELEIHLEAITYPSLRGISESALHENSELFVRYIAGDKAAQLSMLRGTFMPTFVETPMLYALCQRANPGTTSWTVPVAISSIRLYRYYRAVTTYICLELQRQQELININKKRGVPLTTELQAVEKSIDFFNTTNGQVQVIAEELCRKRDQRIREIARMIEFNHLHSYLNAKEMSAHIEEHKELLCAWETEMRNMTVELLNIHEAFLAQILRVPGDLAETLYTPERVPPTAAIDANFKKPMAQSGLELLKIRHQDMRHPSQVPIPVITQARQDSYQFLSLIIKNTEPLFHCDDQQQQKYLCVDEILPRAYYWVMLQLLMHERQVKDTLDKGNVFNEKKHDK